MCIPCVNENIVIQQIKAQEIPNSMNILKNIDSSAFQASSQNGWKAACQAAAK